MGQQPPAFQFYARDFDASVRAWSLAERGAYISLLTHQWECGYVPDDIQAICRVLGAFPDEVRPIWENCLSDKFPVCKDGRRRNLRLESVREEQAAYRQKKIDAGRKGAQKRWGSREDIDSSATSTDNNSADGGAISSATSKPNDKEMALQSPTPTPTPTPKTTGESSDSPPARAREDRDQEQGDELPEHKRNFLACVNQLKKYTDTEIHGGLLLQWAKRIQPEGLEWIYMELADRGMFDELKDPKELKRYLAGCVKNAEKEYAEFEKRVTPAARRHAS